MYGRKKTEELDTEEAIQVIGKVLFDRANLRKNELRENSPDVERVIDFIKTQETEGEQLGTGTVARVMEVDYEKISDLPSSVEENIRRNKIAVKFLVNEQQRILHGNTFEQEADHLNRLKGFVIDNIRAPLCYFCDVNGSYIGMEKVDGKSLRDIKNDKDASQDLIRTIKLVDKEVVMQKFETFLSQMHEQKKTIHRDIDEGNIMIDKDGNWFLIDFGRAVTSDLLSGHSDDQIDAWEKEDILRMRETIRFIYKVIED